jgi:hypothetical protein
MAAVGGHVNWYRYAAFAIGLFGRRVSAIPQTATLQCDDDPAVSASYAVITLNYDRILESACELANEKPFEGARTISFDVDGARSVPSEAVPLVKLHGSIDQSILVPPTWQKTLHPEVKALWQRAHTLLTEANHHRIVGYSLQPTDDYVPYLLKAGLGHARHLKSVHVLCLDNANEAGIERRYEELMSPDCRHLCVLYKMSPLFSKFCHP